METEMETETEGMETAENEIGAIISLYESRTQLTILCQNHVGLLKRR